MRAHPRQHGGVAGRISRKRPGAQHPAHLVHHRGHVRIGVGVHAPVTSPACSAILDMTSPSSPVPGRGEGDATGPGACGQNTSGTPKVRLLPGHGRPRPAVTASSRQPRPGGSAARHAICGQLGAEPRPGPAAGHDQPARGPLWITRGQPCAYPTARTIARTNPGGSVRRGIRGLPSRRRRGAEQIFCAASVVQVHPGHGGAKSAAGGG